MNRLFALSLVSLLSLTAAAQTEVDPKGAGAQVEGAQRRPWSNASLTRGPNGELILSDPKEGSVVMEKGPNGKTRIQTRDGNYTIDNGLLLELTRRKGREVLLDQLQGK